MPAPNRFTSASDEELAEGIAAAASAPADAQAALGELARRHGKALLAFLASRLEFGVAEDLVQEVWLQAWRSLTGGAWKRQHLRGWLFQVAKSRMIDHVRKMKPALFDGNESDIASKDGAPIESALIAERQAALRRCLEGLSAEEATVVRARLDGDNYQALSKSSGIDPHRAYGVLSTAKKKLRQCLGTHADEA